MSVEITEDVGQAHQHVGQTIATAVAGGRIIRRKLAAETEAPAGLAHLEKIELAEPDLGTQFDDMLSMNDAQGVAILKFLAGAEGGSIAGLAEPWNPLGWNSVKPLTVALSGTPGTAKPAPGYFCPYAGMLSR